MRFHLRFGASLFGADGGAAPGPRAPRHDASHARPRPLLDLDVDARSDEVRTVAHDADAPAALPAPRPVAVAVVLDLELDPPVAPEGDDDLRGVRVGDRVAHRLLRDAVELGA